jgi:hypothetical protein
MKRFFVGLLAVLPVVSVACGDDDDDGEQAGGTGGTAGSSSDAGAGGEDESAGGTGASTGGMGGIESSAGRGGEAGGDSCVREYDLDSYDGDTEGLCDAAEVNRCDNRCGDIGEAITVLCAPDRSGCIYQSNICADGPECGWIDCWDSSSNEVCADLEETIEEVKDQEGPTQCVRDSDCGAEATCSRRIANLMVCDPVGPSQGGSGGESGAGGFGGGE